MVTTGVVALATCHEPDAEPEGVAEDERDRQEERRRAEVKHAHEGLDGHADGQGREPGDGDPSEPIPEGIDRRPLRLDTRASARRQARGS